MRKTAIPFLLVLITGCAKKVEIKEDRTEPIRTEQAHSEQAVESSVIIDALRNLQERTNDDRFVIFTDPSSGRHVQFLTKNGNLVHFNFPIRTALEFDASDQLCYNVPVEVFPTKLEMAYRDIVSESELKRLEGYLEKCGIVTEKSIWGGRDPEDNYTVKGYMEWIEGTIYDLTTVEEFIEGVFTDVYQIPVPEEYEVTEN